MHLGSFSYQMWRFKSYFGLFICLQKEKSSKFKKCRAGTISIFWLFSRPILFNIWKMHLESFSYHMWIFEKYYGLFIAYKSIENGKSRKSSRRDKNAYLCLPSHLGSWIQTALLPIRFHIRMENFLTKNISFWVKLVYKKSVFPKSSRRDICGGFSTKSKFLFKKVPNFYISPFLFNKF